MKQINSLKNATLLLVLLFAASISANAQLSGTYTVGGSSPDYSTLSAAVSDLNANGVNGPVTFLIRDGSYSGNSWRASINNIAGASNTNRITFRSQSGNRANVVLQNNSSNNYIFRFNNARYITVKDMTLEKTTSSYCRVFDFGSTGASYDSVVNCVIKAPVIRSSSNARALVYGYGHTGSNNVFYNNEFQNGGQWIYIRGNSTSSNPTNMIFADNKFIANNSGYYGIYFYYSTGLKFLNNEFNRNGSSTYYFGYIYYPRDDFQFNNNTVDVQTSSTLYGLRFYYMNYYSSNSSLTPEVNNNNITFKNSGGSTYPFYTYRAVNGTYLNNVVNTTTTSGRIYSYGPLYYNDKCRAEGNTLNFKTSSSYVYTQYMCYNGANYPDTFHNNVVNIDSRYVYNYLSYYGNTRITNNVYNTKATSTTYNYMYYSNGVYFANNEVKSTTNGTLYGIYEYGSSSYSGGTVLNNKFDFQSTSTVYGFYSYYSKMKYKSNLLTVKTGSSSYGIYARYNYSSKFINNTIHNMGTGSTSYGAYIYNTSSSYKTELKNNIISKASGNSYGIYIYNKNYFEADNNLYYVPSGGTTFYSNSPSYQGNSLQQWRDKTGEDMNSLVYEPPYVNAAGGDFHINASSPAAWAVNGRAEHDTTIQEDIDGNTRPKLAPDGVPDLGAYEVNPTSTPPNAVAMPANPVANSTQVFTFGQDTVGTIDWGSTVPSTFSMRQYSGIQAAPMPTGVGRMYFYTAASSSSWVHPHTANIRYKDFWIGDIPGENEAVIARSSNGGAWEGYNYTNANTNTVDNILAPANALDSVGGYTGVQNGRIGIRCVENPKGIVISNITAFDADVDWAPVFNPIGYQVVLKKVLEAPSVSEWNNASFPTSNSLSLSGLDEDTKYYLYIRSVCGVKDTSGYTVDSFITLITCHDPTIGINDLSDKRAVIYWNDIKTAVRYEYLLTTSPTPPTFGTDINKTSVLAPFLDADKQYYVHVRAHCSSIYSESGWSTAQFKTWPLGVNSVSVNGNGIEVHPNPVTSDMQVVLNTAGGTLSVLDMTGKVLKVQSVTGTKVMMNVSELPAGVYVLQYVNDEHSEQIRFNKQ